MKVSLDIAAPAALSGGEAPTATPATKRATPAAPVKEAPATHDAEPGGDEDFVTLDDEPAAGDGEGDDGEDHDDDGAEGRDERGEEDRPQRRTRGQRRRDAIRRRDETISTLQDRLDDALARLDRIERAPRGDDGDADADLVEPKEADFPNDYLAFERAHADWRTRRAIREETRRSRGDDVERSGSEAAERVNRARAAIYNERLDAVKDRIPDFDKVMKSAAHEIRDDIRDMVLESEKGPLLAYYLAKNPDVVDDLNRMSPARAAREIGKLEGRIRGPKAKTVSKAPEPSRMPRGGSTRTGGAVDLAKIPMEEYVKGRESGRF